MISTKKAILRKSAVSKRRTKMSHQMFSQPLYLDWGYPISLTIKKRLERSPLVLEHKEANEGGDKSKKSTEYFTQIQANVETSSFIAIYYFFLHTAISMEGLIGSCKLAKFLETCYWIWQGCVMKKSLIIQNIVQLKSGQLQKGPFILSDAVQWTRVVQQK